MDIWKEPDYTMVDIVSLEMELEKRRKVEDFVIQFFKDWESGVIASQQQQLVYTCQKIMRQSKLVDHDYFKHIDHENFKPCFHTMCMELFKNGVADEYVISLLAFCIEVNVYMQNHHHIWYTSRQLITPLIGVLEQMKFDPIQFNLNQTERDFFVKIATSFVIIIPSLLFFYLLLK